MYINIAVDEDSVSVIYVSYLVEEHTLECDLRKCASTSAHKCARDTDDHIATRVEDVQQSDVQYVPVMNWTPIFCLGA